MRGHREGAVAAPPECILGIPCSWICGGGTLQHGLYSMCCPYWCNHDIDASASSSETHDHQPWRPWQPRDVVYLIALASPNLLWRAYVWRMPTHWRPRLPWQLQCSINVSRVQSSNGQFPVYMQPSSKPCQGSMWVVESRRLGASPLAIFTSKEGALWPPEILFPDAHGCSSPEGRGARK